MRKAPADFVEMRMKHSIPELMEIWGVSRRRIAQFTRETGFYKKAHASTLDGVRAQFIVDAGRMTVADLSRKYGVAHKTARQWCKRVGITPPEYDRFVHAPEGFEEAARSMSLRALSDRFGISVKAIRRLIAELGIDRTQVKPVVAIRPSQVTKNSLVRSRRWIKAIESHNVTEQTADSIAADYLRAFEPVSRCNAKSEFDPHGEYWHIRGRRVTSDELMEMAESKKGRLARRAKPVQANYFSL